MNVNKAIFTFIKIGVACVLLLVVVYWAVRLCSVSYDYGYRLFTEPAVEEAPGHDVLVQVKSDMSGRELASLMEEKGLVRDDMLFYAQLLLSGYKKYIRPGVYTLNTSMEPKELMIAMSPDAEETEDTEGGDTEPEDTELTEPPGKIDGDDEELW